jgi:hypothetical protein
VLDHLALYWSSKPPERKHQRHRVKSRVNVTHGYDGVLAALGGSGSPEASPTETWIVENVSAGGFNAGIPEIKGDWLKIGCLLGLQPEGGDNWVLGVVRRLHRDVPQRGSVGIQTIAKSAQVVQLSPGGGSNGETGILLGNGAESPGEARLLLPAGVFARGRNIEYRKGELTCLLMPQAVVDSSDEYELVKFRELIRDTSGDE